MRSARCLLVLLLFAAGTAGAVDLAAVEDFVRGLPSEDAECGFVIGLCRAAGSAARAHTVAANGDRVDEAAAAADAIARKHGGHMPACLATPECTMVLSTGPHPSQ